MENMLNLTPTQLLIGAAFQIWMFVIFPIVIIRKLNYMTALLESQYAEDDQDQ